MSSILQRLFPQPAVTISLLVVWLLAHNRITPGLVALGLLLGVAIPVATRRFWPEYPRRVRYGRAALFLTRVLRDIVIANVRVAWLILGPRSRLRPAFFALPLDIQGRFPTLLLASIISLTPGTVSSDLTEDGRTLLVHGLDVEDADRAVAAIKARYERPLMEIFE